MYNHAISDNKRNTVIVMILFILLVGLLGLAVGYFANSMEYAICITIFGIVYAFIQYFLSMRLAIAMTGAIKVDRKVPEQKRLYNIVENLSIQLNLPMPEVYIIEDPAPNAFAAGRDPKHSIVCATSGIIELMNDSELEAVMAHEMGHVQNYDIRVSTIAFGLASAIALISDLGLRLAFFSDDDDREMQPIVYVVSFIAIILAPVIAMMIQMAISRQREYLADATSAKNTSNPDAMISALKKLEGHERPMEKQSSATSHMFFLNPLKPGFFSKMLSTHPPLEDRIKRLEEEKSRF
jgi:protease htpX homolog